MQLCAANIAIVAALLKQRERAGTTEKWNRGVRDAGLPEFPSRTYPPDQSFKYQAMLQLSLDLYASQEVFESSCCLTPFQKHYC